MHWRDVPILTPSCDEIAEGDRVPVRVAVMARVRRGAVPEGFTLGAEVTDWTGLDAADGWLRASE